MDFPYEGIRSSYAAKRFAYKIRTKVSNAATSGTSGLQWFKVSQNGLDSSGKWGVDRMIANSEWPYFIMPSCVASGQYLLRVEIIGKSICYPESFL